MKIPILAVETRATYAFVFLTLIGLALAGFASRQSYQLGLAAKAQATNDSERPIVLQPRFLGTGDNRLPRRALANLEAVLIWAFHLASAVGAIVIVALVWVAGGVNPLFSAPAFLAALFFSWSTISNLLAIWRR